MNTRTPDFDDCAPIPGRSAPTPRLHKMQAVNARAGQQEPLYASELHVLLTDDTHAALRYLRSFHETSPPPDAPNKVPRNRPPDLDKLVENARQWNLAHLEYQPIPDKETLRELQTVWDGLVSSEPDPQRL